MRSILAGGFGFGFGVRASRYLTSIPVVLVAIVMAVGCIPTRPTYPRRGEPRSKWFHPWTPAEIAEALDGMHRIVAASSLAVAIQDGVRSVCAEGVEPHDVTLVVDTTFSMLLAVSEIPSTAAHLSAAAEAGCRIAVIEYRDHGNIVVARRLLGLEDSPSGIPDSLLTLEAKGGGDHAEAAWSALDLASKELTTVADRRPGLILLVTDAAAHPDDVAEAQVRARMADGSIEISVLHVKYTPDEWRRYYDERELRRRGSG